MNELEATSRAIRTELNDLKTEPETESNLQAVQSELENIENTIRHLRTVPQPAVTPDPALESERRQEITLIAELQNFRAGIKTDMDLQQNYPEYQMSLLAIQSELKDIDALIKQATSQMHGSPNSAPSLNEKPVFPSLSLELVSQFEHIQEQESLGDLEGARRSLNAQPKLLETYPDHAKSIRTVQAMMPGIDTAIGQKRFLDASTRITTFKDTAKLDPIRDYGLLVLLNNKLDKAQEAADIDTKWKAGFEGQFSKNVGEGLITLATWIVCIACAIFLFWFIKWTVRRLPHLSGARISMLDLTAAEADRSARNLALSREIALRVVGAAGSGPALEVDGAPDLDIGRLPNIIFHHGSTLDQLLPLANAVPTTVGPFSINPVQFLALLRQMFLLPCEQEFHGELIAQGENHVVSVGCRSRNPSLDRKRWQSSPTAREDALTEVTTRIAFDLMTPRFTDSFESFFAYRKARATMRGATALEERQDVLKRALLGFRDAIQADPGNWMAWFYLATVLRKVGQNRLAESHFAFVEQLLQRNGILVREFVASAPQFPMIVAYNRAVCLSKLGDWRSHKKAVTMLRDLINQVA